MVDTLIRDQAEFTECRLMLWSIPKEGTKLEGEQEMSGRRAGEEQKASRRRAEGEQEMSRRGTGGGLLFVCNEQQPKFRTSS